MAPCEMQTFAPTRIEPIESSQTPSPIQESSPILRRQGAFTFSRFLRTTRAPTSAPKARNSHAFTRDGHGTEVWKKARFTAIHTARTVKDLPRSAPEFLNLES